MMEPKTIARAIVIFSVAEDELAEVLDGIVSDIVLRHHMSMNS
jgi:hypothetical protein